MTKILTMASDGTFIEADHAAASKALAIASDGRFNEVAATGTRKVVAVASGGSFAEVSVTFSGRPADTVSGIVAAYSTRLLLSSYSGPAIRVQRSPDNAEQDIGFSGGNLDAAALTAFVGPGSGYLVKWYDQSGLGRHLTPLTSNYARVVNAGVVETVNSRPCIRGTTSSQRYRHSLGSAFNSYTSELFSVWSNNGTANARLLSFNPANGTDWSSIGGWAPCGANEYGVNRHNYAYYGGTSEVACSAGELAACYSNHTANNYLFIAKGAYTASASARPWVNSSYINLGTSDGSTNYAPVGCWCEAVVTNAIQSDYTSFLINQRGYWGV